MATRQVSVPCPPMAVGGFPSCALPKIWHPVQRVEFTDEFKELDSFADK